MSAPRLRACRLALLALTCLALLLATLAPQPAALRAAAPPPSAARSPAPAFLRGPPCPPLDAPRLSNVFAGTHLVLQCAPAAARLWGWAAPGCALTARLHGAAAAAAPPPTTSYDETGLFIVSLPPLPCGNAPLTLTLASASGAPPLNVSFTPGHVIFCAGQSNIVGLSLAPGYEADSSVAASLQVEPEEKKREASAPLPLYGLAVGMLDPWAGDAPLAELASAPEQPWAPLATAAQAARYSALCWWAGRALARRRGGAEAVGLVVAAWSGSWLQAWATPPSLASCSAPPFGAPWAPASPSALHNAMVAPFAVGPLALSGIIWAQGESNALVSQASYYACGLAAAIRDWRALFAAPGLFVGLVELAPFGRSSGAWGGGWVGVRAAQLAVARDAALPPPVVLVPTADCRDLPGDIHPRCKFGTGTRLGEALAAALAAAGAGGAAGAGALAALPRSGPAYSHAERAAGGGGVRVHFVGAARGVAWVVGAGREACEGVEAGACGGAQVRGEDGAWEEAGVEAGGGGTLLLRGGAAAAAATATRYGRGMWPANNCVDAETGWPCHPWEAEV